MTKRNSFIESTKETDERLEALKQLYPEIFSDGKINLDAFKDVTGTSDLPEGQDRTPGYYGLYWPGRRAAKQLARKEAEGTLEPVPGDGVNENTTHNIYIEGDNLEVLRILKQSYKGRVKMIYIDPPYNTGNDFIYPDDFKMPVEEYLKITGQADDNGKVLTTNTKDSGAYHTNWLNMMYPRLKLAMDLLSDDGVIFISIDDNEQANLKLLCDDIFGEENVVANIPWQSRASIQNDTDFSVNHEYIVCYAKKRRQENRRLKEANANVWYKKDSFVCSPMPLDKDKFDNPDNDPRGLWKADPFDAPHVRPNLTYPITNPNTGEQHLPPRGRCWRTEQSQFANALKDNRIIFGSDGKGRPQLKVFYEEKKAFGSIDNSWFSSDRIGTATNGTKEIMSLFDGAKMFDTPKPTTLLDKLLSLANLDDNSIVMDFYSGSATTAHSVLKLNMTEKTKRKFIMVQLPFVVDDSSEAFNAGFKNICEIGKERIRRAGSKILEEAKSNKDMFSEDYQLDIGFKVYRLQNSNFVKYTPVEGQDEDSQNKLFEEFEKNQIPLVQGWKAENVLTEIILKQGFALDCTKENVDSFKKNKIWKITDSADTVSKKIKLYVCLDNFIEEETIKNLTLNDDEKFICLDAAIDDSAYARLADKGRIETI